MQFLISHWHCILPVAGIAAALFFMRDTSKEKNDDKGNNATIPQEDNRD